MFVRDMGLNWSQSDKTNSFLIGVRFASFQMIGDVYSSFVIIGAR